MNNATRKIILFLSCFLTAMLILCAQLIRQCEMKNSLVESSIINGIAGLIPEEGYFAVRYAPTNVNKVDLYQLIVPRAKRNIRLVKEYINAQQFAEVRDISINELPLRFPLIWFSWAADEGEVISNALYSNGFLIMEDGPVYAVNLEWNQIKDAILDPDPDAASPYHYLFNETRIPSTRLLFNVASRTGEWDAQYLPEATERVHFDPNDKAVTADIISITADEINIRITNTSSTWINYTNTSPSIEVFLDGSWYYVPSFLKGKYLTSRNVATATGLEPGQSVDKTVSLKQWKECRSYLPSGHYRIYCLSCTYEFDI